MISLHSFLLKKEVCPVKQLKDASEDMIVNASGGGWGWGGTRKFDLLLFKEKDTEGK